MPQSTIAELQAELARLSEEHGPETVVQYWFVRPEPDVSDWLAKRQAAFKEERLQKDKAEMAKVITRFSEKSTRELTKQTLEVLLEIKAHEERIGERWIRDPGWMELHDKKDQIKDGFTERSQVRYFSYATNRIGRLSKEMTLDDMKDVIEDVYWKRLSSSPIVPTGPGAS